MTEARQVPGSFASPTEELLTRTYAGDLVGKDGARYSTQVTRVTEAAVGWVTRFDVLDANGVKIGSGLREIQDWPDGPAAMHQLLKIDEAHQGQGLASQINERAEAYYRTHGLTSIRTDATSNPSRGLVGGYVWARRGFGWADAESARLVADQLHAQSLILPGGAGAKVEEAIRLLKTGNLERMPTPREISDLVGDGGAEVGKAALLNQTWSGVRWLPTA